MRRVVLLGVFAALVLVIPVVAAAPVRADQTENTRRAYAAFDAMQRDLYDAKRDRYLERTDARGPAHAWPLSQALAASIDVAKLRHASPVLRGRLEELRKGPVYAASRGGSVYWDDNEWIAQDLLAVGDVRSRARARAMFDAIVRAWDNDGSKPCAGGVQWTEAPGNDDRNTVSTVNGALVGLKLYARTKQPRLLTWSRRMLTWAAGCMRADDGLYRDHIRGDGSVDTTEWSYNQGSIIGALTVLAQTTGDKTAISRAEALADATLSHFDGRWSAEPPEFAAIFFRNLLALAAVDGRGDYVAAAQGYADTLWSARRGPRLLDRAALVQVYAALATAGA